VPHALKLIRAAAARRRFMRLGRHRRYLAVALAIAASFLGLLISFNVEIPAIPRSC